MLAALTQLGSILTHECPACSALAAQGRRCADCQEDGLADMTQTRDRKRFLELSAAFEACRVGKASPDAVLSIAQPMQHKMRVTAAELRGMSTAQWTYPQKSFFSRLIRIFEQIDRRLGAFVASFRQGNLYEASNQLNNLRDLIARGDALLDKAPPSN